MPESDLNMSHRVADIINKLVPLHANFGECETVALAAIPTVQCYRLIVDPVQRADSGMECSSLGNVPKQINWLEVCHRDVKRLLN